MSETRIGFIGLGEMGEPMAARLLNAGFTVSSCAHRRRQAIEILKQKGLIERPDPGVVAQDADILITIVLDKSQTDQVLHGPNGALSRLRDGATIIVMSTLDPDYCRTLAETVQSRGIGVVECPVSGARPRAENGTLVLIAGGDPAVIERCRPGLEPMGTIHFCGGLGAAMAIKLANNALAIGTFTILLEVRAVARAYGADMEALMAVCRNGTANSFVVQAWDWIAANLESFSAIAPKDVGLCRAAAVAKGVPTPVIEALLAKDWKRIGAGAAEL
jgi:3-hydroxyisobutyrate dehydrogenase